MDVELLDAPKVRKMITDRGVLLRWVWEKHLGLKRSQGYQLFQNGVLPKDPEKKKMVLKELASFLGVEVGDLLLRLRPRRTA